MSIKLSRWLLGSLLLLLLGLLIVLYHYWPSLIYLSTAWQQQLQQQLTQSLIAIRKQPDHYGYGLLALSFLYGVLHAAGPGHGKLVISTYLATQPVYYRQALWLVVLSSLLQTLVAISLICGLQLLFNLTQHSRFLAEYYLSKGSYLLVLILGLVICWRALQQLYQQLRVSQSHAPCQQHNHTADCCSHHHMATNEQLQQSQSWSRFLLLIVAMGIRPCSGALLLLLMANFLGLQMWGIIAVICMAAGTALMISLLASLVIFSRQRAQQMAHFYQAKHWRITSQLLRLLGGMVLIVLMLVLLQLPQMTNPLLR